MKHLFTILILLLAVLAAVAAPNEEALRIGVLAYRPKAQTVEQWRPVAAYLEKALGRRVELAVYDHTELTDAAAQRAVDVVFTTPNHFILLQHTAGVSAPLATLLTREGKYELSGYGGVILARADRDNIRSLADLAGKRIAVVSTDAFGGFQMQAAELVEAGLPMPASERLRITGQPHDRVIEAVLEGRADAGFVRAGVIEAMVQEGRLDQRRIKIINLQNIPAFPYAVSTKLYPEWPVVVMPQMDEKTASRLAAALFLLPRDHLGGVAGFTTPANYAGVENLMRSLRQPPFEQAPDIRLRDLWHRYAAWIVALGGLMLLLTAASAGLVALYRRSRQSEVVLRENEEFLSSVVENIPDMIFVKEARELRFVRFNKAGEVLLGYGREELLGKNDHDLFPKAQADFFTGKDREVLQSGQVSDIAEEVIDTKAGQRTLHTKKIPILDRNGAPAYLLGISEDITERKRAEQALLDSRLRMDNIVANSPGAIYRCANDPEWTMEFLSAAITQITGYPADDFLNNGIRSYASIIHPDDRRAVEQAVSEGLERKDRYDIDYRIVATDGTPRWVHEQGRGVFAPDGRLLCLDGVIFDITGQRKAEEEIRQLNAELELRVQDRTRELAASEERMRQFFERQLVGMAITSPEKGWVQVNDKICEMMGYSREELLRLSWAEMTYPDDLVSDVTQFERMLRGEIDSYMLEKRFIRKDGGIIFTNLAVGCVRRADRSVDYVLALLEDISGRKRAEENIHELNAELQQRAKALEDVNKELEAFAYSVSHDLRTPLRAIDGFSHILLEDYRDKLDDEGKRLLNVVRDNTSRMGQLIDDILKFSRAGRLEINFSRIDMEHLAHSVFEELQPSVAGGKLQLEIEHLPPATGDSAMMRQVFVNLLSNAIKFSRTAETPKVLVGATVKDSETVYCVKDNGVGFDMQYANKLFGVFQRLHSVSEFEGTGIGLAIVKRIVTRHGGRVWAEGKVNGGATFYFSIPISAIQPQKEAS